MTPLYTLVRANNPGPMTLEGTNTWLIRDGHSFVVVDPGPLLEEHIENLVTATSGQVSRVLLTHGHPDHAEGAAAFAARVDAPISATDRTFGEPISDGDVFGIDGGKIQVIGTPGHTGDSTTFLVDAHDGVALLTGDTVLGRGTTVVLPPDGTLRDYLVSLDLLEELATDFNAQGRAIGLLPGHGPQHVDALPVIRYYINHRQERLNQVRAAIASGVNDPTAIVNTIYADVPDDVKAAALMSVRAQLEFLNGRDG